MVRDARRDLERAYNVGSHRGEKLTPTLVDTMLSLMSTALEQLLDQNEVVKRHMKFAKEMQKEGK